MTGRPWIPPPRPPWAPPERRPPWWHGIGHRAAVVAALVLLDPARAVRVWAQPIIDFRKDSD